MNKISNDDLNRVRQSVDISEIISEYIPIEKKGRNFVALCPFHDDNNPSMTISPDKQIYKCFVCGAGGNVFSFVQNYEKVSFVEAVAKIASKTDVDLNLDLTQQTKVDPRQNHLFEIMKEAETYLNYQLINSTNDYVRNYVKGRHLDDETIAFFQIGYEFDNSLVNFMKRKGYELEDLVSINLVNSGQYGESSVFNNRLTFPIHDQHGHTVGFTARALSDTDSAKYVNSNENEIYTKGNILYNHHRAQSEARRAKEVFLVEGVMDVVAFHKAGVDQVVASLGTALTDVQARKLRTLAPHVVITYDGDSAGNLATLKAIQLLLSFNISIEVHSAFGEYDPDDYLQKYGAEEFKDTLKTRTTWMDFVILYHKVQFNLDNYLERKEFVNELLKYEKYIMDSFDREYFLEQIKTLSGFGLSQLQELQPIEKPIAVKVRKKALISKHNRVEYGIIGQMLSGKQAAYDIRDNLGFLHDDDLYKLYLLIIDYYSKNDEMMFADLLSWVNDEHLESLLTDIFEDQAISKEYNPKIISESIKSVQAKVIEQKIKSLKQTKTDDILKKAEIATEIASLHYKKEKLLNE